MVNTVKCKHWEDTYGEQYFYNGEVDLSDTVCGYGTAFSIDDPNVKYQGTFFNGKVYGIGMLLCMQDKDLFKILLQGYSQIVRVVTKGNMKSILI